MQASRSGSQRALAPACLPCAQAPGHALRTAPRLPPPAPAQAPSGAAGEAALRPWWRGRVGLSKPEQLQHFEAGLRDIEDLRM